MKKVIRMATGASAIALAPFLLAEPQIVESQPVSTGSASTAESSSQATAVERVVEIRTDTEELRKLQNQIDGMREGLTGMLTQVMSLQQENRLLTGQVEELQYQVRQYESASKDRYVDLDSRISQLLAELAAATERIDSLESRQTLLEAKQAEVVAAASAAPAVTPKVEVPAETPDLPEQPSKVAKSGDEAYEEAMSLIRNKEFEAAISAFRTFLIDYPGHELTPNAFYWLGQVYYSQSKVAEAEAAFLAVLENFPDSNKVPDASYKLAYLAEKKGQVERAKSMYEAVIADYPDTTAAQFAQRQLGNL